MENMVFRSRLHLFYPADALILRHQSKRQSFLLLAQKKVISVGTFTKSLSIFQIKSLKMLHNGNLTPTLTLLQSVY